MRADGLRLFSSTSLLENVRIEYGAAFTANPSVSQLFYLSEDLNGDYPRGLYVYDGSSWKTTLTLPDFSVKTGATFPDTPYDGQLFYLNTKSGDNDVGIYRFTTSGNAWKYAAKANVDTGATFPASPSEGQLFYLSTKSGNNEAGLYRYNALGSTWQYATSAAYVAEDVEHKNAANGYAGLDANGLISSSQLPSIAITDTFTVASQSAMLALSAQTGDIAIRTDISKCFVLSTNTPAVLASWKELITPTDTVLSVNGQTGAVVTITAGSAFPGSAIDKQLFFLNAQSGNYKKGLYYYNVNAWAPAYYDVNVPYDIAGYMPGLPIGGSKMMLMVTLTDRPYTIPANFAGSLCKSAIAASSTTVYSVRKNDTEVATITFTAGATNGTFSTQGAVTFVGGDILSILAPNPQDGTHADIMWTFLANLS